MIPADAPPSLDGHRETTYATVHSAAPFYSTLIRVNPNDPSSTTDFVCDLCTAMPKPTDDGKTYTFKIRDDVQVPRRVAADRRRCGGELERDHPPAGRRHERARELFRHGRHGRRPRPDDRGVPSEVRDRRLSAGSRRPLCLDLQEGDPRQGPALVREEHPRLWPVQIRRIRDRSVDQRSAQPRLLSSRAALSRRLHRHLCRQAGGPGRGDPRRPSRDGIPRPAALRRATSSSRSSATRSRCRRATGTASTW